MDDESESAGELELSLDENDFGLDDDLGGERDHPEAGRNDIYSPIRERDRSRKGEEKESTNESLHARGLKKLEKNGQRKGIDHVEKNTVQDAWSGKRSDGLEASAENKGEASSKECSGFEKKRTSGNMNSGNKKESSASTGVLFGEATRRALTWSDLHLSRPFLRALDQLGWVTPTDIQVKGIPPALEGRDILGMAETGSGKTAAFLLPILERLYNSPAVRGRKKTSVGIVGGRVATKALLLLPTRELAAQCFEVFHNLTEFTNITGLLVSGGIDMKSQEISLRNQPDVVIATPGRVLDLLINSQSVNMELLEIIVFDEADRLLDLGFKDECLAVLRHCAKNRQTLLFSATLTEGISDLAVLALKNPTKIEASRTHTVVPTLEQEFVKLPKEIDAKSTAWRDAALLHLCTNIYTKRAIVFFQKKVDAHRVVLFFRRLAIPCAELHGNLNQTQRHQNYQRFLNGEVEFLLASELASRGLDIPNVETVINFHPAWDLARHVHRVGRTARMGRPGRAVTLFDPSERLAVKKLAKSSKALNAPNSRPNAKGRNNTSKETSDGFGSQTQLRTIPLQALQYWKEKMNSVQKEVKQTLLNEAYEKELDGVDATLSAHDEMKNESTQEILSKRIPREWHLTKKEKGAIGSAAKNAALERKQTLEGENAYKGMKKVSSKADMDDDETQDAAEREEASDGDDDDGNMDGEFRSRPEGKKRWRNEPENQGRNKKPKKVKVKENTNNNNNANKSHKGAKRMTRKEREVAEEARQIQKSSRKAKKGTKRIRMRITDACIAKEKVNRLEVVKRLKDKTRKKKVRKVLRSKKRPPTANKHAVPQRR